ncbi:hypothetical protein [Nostoc sp.]|uniref:hypothetical protein n=1 Tax=Nostoc sp. TaxID=1180 RepID=UPI002FFABD0B
MSKFSLAPYTLRLKRKNSSNYFFFEDVLGLDFIDVLYEYLSNVLPSLPINNQTGEVIKVTSIKKENRTICGQFESGQNGYGSRLLNTVTDTVSYERNTLDAELIPYYFLVRLPSKVDKGIVILQRFNNIGVKTLFFDNFTQYLKAKISDEYILEINPLVPKGLIKEYINGRFIKLRFIKQGYPKDIIDIPPDAMPDDNEFDGESELILSAPKNGILPYHIRSIFSKNLDKFLSSDDVSVGSIIEVKNFDYDNIKMQVRVGNSYKTINLSDMGKLRYYEDISGIDLNTNGHPKFDIIDSVAKSLLKDLAMSIWGDNVDA